jgi:hypothetical protein
MVSFTRLDSSDGFRINEDKRVDLDQVEYIDIHEYCRRPCEHYCSFKKSEGQSVGDYLNAKQISELFKKAKDKIRTTSHFHKTPKEPGKSFCLIQ